MRPHLLTAEIWIGYLHKCYRINLH